MEIYNNKVCLSYKDLTSGHQPLLTKSNYDKHVQRNKVKVARRACRGVEALVYYDSLPGKLRDSVVARYGNVEDHAKRGGLRSMISYDAKAFSYYQEYMFDNGRKLDKKYIQEYTLNATVLNAANAMLAKRKGIRKAASGSVANVWASVAEEVTLIKDEYPHTLPENAVRLKAKLNQYVKEGYGCLVSGKFGNNNSRKVSDRIERLLLALYTLPNKPYTTSVLDLYLQFLSGAISVVDQSTGEVFQREDYYDDEGTPIVISESTVWNYLNRPSNRVLVDKRRSTGHEFNAMHRPHHVRKSPVWSLSKVSMDDRDLPRKMHDGNRVKVYYAFDVTSQCVIGKSYSKSKDTGLFIDCMRDMVNTLRAHNLGMPMELEVEHHLVNNFKDTFMQDGVIVPYVRWCNPSNSREKRAEHMIRSKKYGAEKSTQVGIGRFYLRDEANRPKIEKVFDEKNNTYKEKTFSYEELVADDLHTIDLHNNALHPNQKKYKGLTRWQVFMQNVNPDVTTVNMEHIAYYLGEIVDTSIRNNAYLTVQYNRYAIPNTSVLKSLKPNVYKVQAVYWPGEEIESVYVYQDGKYICTCDKVVSYQEARAEQTDEDIIAFTEQAKLASKFDAYVKSNKADKVTIIANEDIDDAISAATAVSSTTYVDVDEASDFDLDEILAEMDAKEIAQRAYDEL